MSLNRQYNMPGDSPEAENAGLKKPYIDSRGRFNLESYNQHLNTRLKALWEKRNLFLQANGAANTEYLQSLKNIQTYTMENEPEVLLAIAGDVSAGKSSLLNAICAYPIIPAAPQTTSICPVEIRSVSSKEEERIEVCLYAEDRKSLEAKPVKVFQKQIFGDQLLQDLSDYALFLDSNCLSIGDTLSFFYNTDRQPVFIADDWRHTMLLLMILLDTYVGQNGIDITPDTEKAIGKRNALLNELEIPTDRDYGIRLFLNSPLIPKNTAIVDLPGLGSAAAEIGNHEGHTRLVMNYVGNAQSLLFLIDETGTLKNQEARQLLDSYLRLKSAKSSARLTFVMNRADLAGRTDEKMEKTIRTSIQSFRRDYKDYRSYPVYATSARAGERNFLDQGIAVENLNFVRESIEQAREDGRSVSDAELTDKMEKKYSREYPFQTAYEGPFGKMSIGTFLNEFFGEYVSRVRLLNLLENSEKYALSVGEIAAKIALERRVAEMASRFGPQCANKLTEAIQTAMNLMIESLSEAMTKLDNEMVRKFGQMQNRLDPIVGQFDKDYKKLSEAINEKLRNCVVTMEKNPNGTIPIGSGLFGTNQAGYRNRKKLLHTADNEIGEKMRFTDFFLEAFHSLREELDEEQKLYDQFVEEICTELDNMPEQTEKLMDETFQNILKAYFEESLKESGIERVSAFDEAMEQAKGTTKELLKRICQMRQYELRKDKNVQQVMESTATTIRGEFMGLFAPYSSGYYGYYIINRIQRFRLIAANTINQTQLEAFLKNGYLSDFKEKMKGILANNLGVSVSGRVLYSATSAKESKDTHIQRMRSAMKNVRIRFISQDAMKDIKQQVMNACTVTKKLLADPASIRQWKKTLDRVADGMRFFAEGEDTIENTLLGAENELTSAPWAAEHYKKAVAQMSEMKASIERLNKDGGPVSA